MNHDRFKTVAFRLVTGEYVIANLVGESSDPTTMTLQDPLLFDTFQGNEPGKMGVRFLSSLIPGGAPGDTVEIKDRDVMFIINRIHPEIIKRFNSVISNIVVPT